MVLVLALVQAVQRSGVSTQTLSKPWDTYQNHGELQFGDPGALFTEDTIQCRTLVTRTTAIG